MNKKKMKPLMETRFLGCSHTENAITMTAATTSTMHKTLKKYTVSDLEELTKLIKLNSFTVVLIFFSQNIGCLFALIN